MKILKLFQSDHFNFVVKNRFIIKAITLLMVNGFSIKSLEIIRLSIQLKQVENVRKIVRNKINKFNEINQINRFNNNINHHDTIWVCWFQGIENAPDLVKECYKRINQIEGKKIVLITSDNYKEYTKFPEYIIRKWESGIINPTHFSDLLRIELLSLHGGIWLDATVYLTSKNLPAYLEKSSFFCYRVLKPGLNGHSIICSSWAMSGARGNIILSLTRDIIYEYWKNNDSLSDYFLFHIILSSTIFELENEGVFFPKQCNSIPHILQLELYSKFSNERMLQITESTHLHKLTYKLDEDKCIEGTFIRHILSC